MNNKDQEEQQKSKAGSAAIGSLQMSNEDILKEIHYCASVPPPYGNDTSLKRSLAYFSSLLLNLSRQAEESTKRNIEIQEKLTDLTKKLYFLTVVLLLVALLQIFLPYIHPPQNIEQQIMKKADNQTELNQKHTNKTNNDKPQKPITHK
jgi:hypothetical protein